MDWTRSSNTANYTSMYMSQEYNYKIVTYYFEGIFAPDNY